MTMSIRAARPMPSLHPLAATAARRERTSARLAAGKRIATAGDDPAGLAIAARLQAAARGLRQGERNVADGQSVLRVADGAMSTSQDDLARMRELAVQARNGTLSAADRDAIQQEYDQLAAQLDQTAGGASFGGRSLLDGSASGPGSLAIVDGAGGDQALPLPDARANALGVAGRSVADAATVQALDAASEQLAAARGRLGAADSAFDRRGRQLGAAATAAEEARSRIEDVDVAAAVADQTRDRILLGLQVSGLAHSRRGFLDRRV
jgi:flagellin